MIQSAVMGSVHKQSDSGSGSTEFTAFIQCVGGREPQIYELWSRVLDKIIYGVHPTAQLEVTDETVG